MERVGRVELGDLEAAALARTKAVHVILLVFAVLGSVLSAKFGGALIVTLLMFLLGGVVESFVPGAPTLETLKRIGKVVGAWLLGFFGFFLLTDLASK